MTAFDRAQELGGDPVQASLDQVSDVMMDVHITLADTEWDDLATTAYDTVAEVDALPLGNGADSRFERTLWMLGPAIIHDRIVERCNEPARDSARDRRDEFLEQSP